MITEKAYAKINLALDVIRKLKLNLYHNKTLWDVQCFFSVKLLFNDILVFMVRTSTLGIVIVPSAF